MVHHNGIIRILRWHPCPLSHQSNHLTLSHITYTHSLSLESAHNTIDVALTLTCSHIDSHTLYLAHARFLIVTLALTRTRTKWIFTVGSLGDVWLRFFFAGLQNLGSPSLSNPDFRIRPDWLTHFGAREKQISPQPTPGKNIILRRSPLSLNIPLISFPTCEQPST